MARKYYNHKTFTINNRPLLEVVKTWEDGSIELVDENGNPVYACLRGGLCND